MVLLVWLLFFYFQQLLRTVVIYLELLMGAFQTNGLNPHFLFTVNLGASIIKDTKGKLDEVYDVFDSSNYYASLNRKNSK